MNDSKAPRTGWATWNVPLLTACWLIGYWAPWVPPGTRSAWLQLAFWADARGLHSLEISSRLVTSLGAATASAGALLRLSGRIRGPRQQTLQQLGLLLTSIPLCLVMPVGGAAFFLAALLGIVLAGWRHAPSQASARRLEPLWHQLLWECFPLLAAVCFITMSWQYNAQWLLRSLLISAGIALVARAALPMQQVAQL